jgi:hypothetical protein
MKTHLKTTHNELWKQFDEAQKEHERKRLRIETNSQSSIKPAVSLKYLL